MKQEDDVPTAPRSRRSAIQWMGAGLAVPAFSVGLAAAQTNGDGAPTRPVGPRDPRDAYPKPPFPAQQQERPGLAARMTPRPDHGEKSYVGSGRLAGRKALITGGDSGIGRAAAIAYARAGADVAFGYLAVEEDAKEVVQLMREAGRKAIPLPGDIRDAAFCKKMVGAATGSAIINTASSCSHQAKPASPAATSLPAPVESRPAESA